MKINGALILMQTESYLPFKAGLFFTEGTRRKSEEKFITSRVNWVAPCSDFSGTAAICELLDVVVTVDTSIAHLPLRWESQHCCYCRFAQIGGGAKEARVRLGILVALYSGKRSLTNGKRHLNLFVRQLPE